MWKFLSNHIHSPIKFQCFKIWYVYDCKTNCYCCCCWMMKVNQDEFYSMYRKKKKIERIEPNNNKKRRKKELKYWSAWFVFYYLRKKSYCCFVCLFVAWLYPIVLLLIIQIYLVFCCLKLFPLLSGLSIIFCIDDDDDDNDRNLQMILS